MARMYDSRTTMLSPEGRLMQVEYAMEAVGKAGTCLGMVTKDGIIIAAERRSFNKLSEQGSFSEKIYKVNEDIACAMAGLTSDGNVLLQNMRVSAQNHFLLYQEPIPVEQLSTQVCDLIHANTMHGGHRPFGVSMLIFGWDCEFGYQLYESDPSGNFIGWKATCIGSSSTAACSMLAQEFDYDKLDLESATKLCVKILYKSMTMTKLTAEKIEIAILKRNDDKTHVNMCPQSDIEALIKDEEQANTQEKQDGKHAL